MKSIPLQTQNIHINISSSDRVPLTPTGGGNKQNNKTTYSFQQMEGAVRSFAPAVSSWAFPLPGPTPPPRRGAAPRGSRPRSVAEDPKRGPSRVSVCFVGATPRKKKTKQQVVYICCRGTPHKKKVVYIWLPELLEHSKEVVSITTMDDITY